MNKQIDADELIHKLYSLQYGRMLIEDIQGLIDCMPAADNPVILYQGMIPLNPRAKKNNQKIIINKHTNRPMVVQGDIYKQYEKECGWFIKSPRTPINCAVNVKCIFYRDSARRCDLTNLLEAIDDILVKYQIIADDNFNIIAGHDGSRVLIDRANPRTEITITSMEAEHECITDEH